MRLCVHACVVLVCGVLCVCTHVCVCVCLSVCLCVSAYALCVCGVDKLVVA